MSLVPNYDGDGTDSDSSQSNSSSSSGDEPLANKNTKDTSAPKNTTKLLPVPQFFTNVKAVTGSSKDDLPKTSVFSNPFVEAENAKQTILEKHVKMVSTESATTINGKKICWNYRKGRCRFGHNCKYAHDSDLQKTKEQLDQETQLQQTVIFQQSQELPQHSIVKHQQSDDHLITIDRKRKRPGLAQGLVPGKKVMKQYEKLKTQ